MITTKNEYTTIGKILDRIDSLNISYSDRLSMLMDLDYAKQHNNLDLDLLLSFENFDFRHDIDGIANHFNRKTYKFDNCFTPKCSR